MSPTCGIWPNRRRGLVAVVADDEGRTCSSHVVPRMEDACWALCEALDVTQGLDWELVVPDWLGRNDALPQRALARGMAVWLVPGNLIEAVRTVAALGTGPPSRMAAALARLPLAPALRAHLRRLTPADRRQLNLL